MQPEFTKSAVVRQQQYRRAADARFCLKTAATIVGGKARNMIAMVNRQRRLRSDPQSPLAELERTLPKLGAARTLDQLNGYEGAAAAA